MNFAGLAPAVVFASMLGLALPAAAQNGTAPSTPSSSGGCKRGSLADGTYETTARERKNRRNNRPVVEAEGTAVTEVTLTFQCGGTGPGGVFIPTGYKIEVEGECPSGTCDLGTTIAVEGPGRGEYSAVLMDEAVGARSMVIATRRKALSLSVRTEVKGERRPASARYDLSAKRGS